jgi:hypothetical protein
MNIIRSDAVKRYRLRKDIAAILADVPDAADHAQGLGWVMEDVLYARMVREGAHESSATRKPASYFAVPGHLRSRLAKELNRAIADSGLRAFDAWKDYYRPLSDIEAGARA